MSAERKPLDFYETPAPLALAICRRLGAGMVTPPRLIIEPSAGTGRFVAAARATWPLARIAAVDIDPGHADALRTSGAAEVVTGDWLRESVDRAIGAGPRLFLGNPPFSDGAAHIEATLETMSHGDSLAFLLRMSMLGSQERARTLWAKPGLRWLMPLAQRPSFTGTGTDNSEYAVFVWTKGHAGNAELVPHLWVVK